MREKIFLNILILCGIFSQKIIQTSSEEDVNESLGYCHRKKRLIDYSPGGNGPVSINQVPYVVSIHEYEKYECVGIILASNVILTAAHCVEEHVSAYSILSGSTFANNGTSHRITLKIVHPGYNSRGFVDDLALLIIHPPINIYHSVNRKIELIVGPVPPYTLGIVSGWGCNRITRRGEKKYPQELRSIIIPIISHEDCVYHYHPRFEITNKDICTHDMNEEKSCSYGDSGAPLVVHSRLVGVFVWSGEHAGLTNPDVFINLDHLEYRSWIMSYIARH